MLRGGFEMSLSDKEKILKEPLSLYEQEAFYKEDVKEAIKEFMKEMVESESMSEELFISRLIINFEEIFGKELCSDTLKGIKEESE